MRKYIAGVLAFGFAAVISTASIAAAGDAAKGEELFNGKGRCKTCHKLDDKAGVGPGMKGATTRASDAWMEKWLDNPQGVWEGSDAETQKLKQWKPGRDKAPKTLMSIPKLTKEEIADLIAFMHKIDGK